jgi:hypothetical protein
MEEVLSPKHRLKETTDERISPLTFLRRESLIHRVHRLPLSVKHPEDVLHTLRTHCDTAASRDALLQARREYAAHAGLLFALQVRYYEISLKISPCLGKKTSYKRVYRRNSTITTNVQISE